MTIPINSTTYPCKGWFQGLTLPYALTDAPPVVRYATPENIAMLHPVATLVSGQPFTVRSHSSSRIY
jgi:hypothetical protein